MEVFNFVYKDDNELFSKFNNSDIEKLIELLKLYQFSYRNSLNIDKEATFGVEIEFASRNPSSIEDEILTYNKEKSLDIGTSYNAWFFKKEDSIENGYEISSPILTDTIETWNMLKDVCNILKDKSVSITETSSSHIHFGDNILEDNIAYWKNFIKLYVAYEHILYRFSYGEYEKYRESLIKYAYPSAKTLNLFLRDFEEDKLENIIYSSNLHYKQDGLNFRRPTINTFEFRSFNGTLDSSIIQNNINFIAHLVSYAKSDNFDYELIEKMRKQQNFSSDSLKFYNEIKINDALELADLIFANNLDKINFLRQYIKDYEHNDKYVKCKTFTKK